jgi:transcriptional regulator GlxA family with amidase domain
LCEVAALLGFSEPSAFSRWHRQQFGSAARQRKASVVDGAIAHRRSRR